VVYCFEQVDTKTPLASLSIPGAPRIALAYHPEFLGGVETLSVEARGEAGAPVTVQAIPYFAWDNRGLAPMTVWLPRTVSGVR
jgi:DUF1680 family protein